MSDKILSKYNIGLSVIVRSKDIDVWDLVIILLQIDSKSVEKFVCVNSEYEVDRKGYLEREKESYKFSKKDNYFSRLYDYNLR